MTIFFFPSIHSEHTGEVDGVSFTATVKNEHGSMWNYRGVATSSALAVLGGNREPLEIFSEFRPKFLEQLTNVWKAQPETAQFIINSVNCRNGGDLVNME
ncbi:hypothetical protein RSP673_012585 [Ralstonia solanacearum P673]|uniref:hypothetical protein n=1 Tax=Ralstonia solanacearum TaxID=305 RepID=UPI000451ABB0|nr:hypothetical protein [Ralstonia solanacearum]EUJ11814.1 hypothetical protein RSP673_24195 [Ralstonia solanacearum P673]MCL9852088.1 hypothetical protein [Ralstonia solanacearum]MCL9856966.1 hypothetical protein [Ralstonia solanacearum]MCL9859725.1 hypothetical protein [Ralstonia solanacearum]MCL9866595.1 hypothetical protein [Ralstonia solanacearum]